VKVPWARKADLPRALIERAYETCKRGDEGHCINTNLVRAFATHLGRTIRHPHTYKGNFHWSEKINGQWCMFVAPLAPKYARRIDAFDHDGKHFWPPVKCPMGPVHFVGFCEPRKVDPATIKERRDRHEARIAAGKLVPGSRFRERQLPYVEIGT
jgi:hypothetical protein